MPKFLQYLLLLPLLLLPCAAPAQGRAGEKPNIIFIMADDLGQEALACYGNDINKTPNLDALAAGGMKFNQAYATPLCTPTRVQVMTGKYNNRNYIVFGLLDQKEKTFGDYMKDAGYATAITGKWQLLGSKRQVKRAGGRIGSTPQQAGFDNYCLWQVEKLGSRYKNATISSNTSGTQTYDGAYGPDIFADYAVQFMRDNRTRPFFLYYPMVLTHDPFQATPDTPGYKTIPVEPTKDPKYFRDMVQYMDKLVGKIVREVKSLGLAENTIIIFTGDNGTGRSIASTVDGKQVQGAKGSSTKYGTNVPLIISWPRRIKPGQANDNLVDFTDFLPTFLDIAGQKPPADAGLDGLSLLSQLEGKPGPVRDYVFCYYHPQLYNDKKVIWAHDKTWKLYSDGKFFNTGKDPLEQHPIPEAELTQPARVAKQKLQKVIKEKLGSESVHGANRTGTDSDNTTQTK